MIVGDKAVEEYDDFEGDCSECGGDGVIFDCQDEDGCIYPERGCYLCELECPICS